MTPTEFNEWYKYHVSVYRGLDAWIQDSPDPKSTLRGWQRAISKISLKDAKCATDAMFRGDAESKGYTDHPAAVNRWQRTISASVKTGPSSTYGRETFRCQNCQDFGSRLVISPRALDSIRRWPAGQEIDPDTKDDKLRPLALRLRLACAVACECQAGDKWTNRPEGHRWGNLPRIHAGMVPIAGCRPTDEEIYALVELSQNYRKVGVFEEWNNGGE